MSRAKKITLGSGSVFLLFLVIGCIANNKSLMDVSFALLVGILILYVIVDNVYDSTKRKQKRFVKKVENVYNLNRLDDVANEVYAACLPSEAGGHYIFMYNCEGKAVLKISNNVKQSYLDKDKDPYVEVCKNVYEPKGFMDWLFYSKKTSEKEKDKIYYILHVDFKNIRFYF